MLPVDLKKEPSWWCSTPWIFPNAWSPYKKVHLFLKKDNHHLNHPSDHFWVPAVHFPGFFCDVYRKNRANATKVIAPPALTIVPFTDPFWSHENHQVIFSTAPAQLLSWGKMCRNLEDSLLFFRHSTKQVSKSCPGKPKKTLSFQPFRQFFRSLLWMFLC